MEGLFSYLTMEEEGYGLWCSGEAECFDCYHRWSAVWPLGIASLECPCCHGDNTDRDAVTGA